jgi:hypothetical protein
MATRNVARRIIATLSPSVLEQDLEARAVPKYEVNEFNGLPGSAAAAVNLR